MRYGMVWASCVVASVVGAAPAWALQASFEHIFVLEHDDDSLWIADPDGGGAVQKSVGNFPLPLHLEIDLPGGRMYYVSDGVNEVRSCDLVGGDQQTIASSSEPRGLALDAGAQQLYWMDRADDVIRRVSVDGGASTVVYTMPPPPCFIPLTLALDVANGHMYWTDPCQGRIFRANMDGSTPAGGAVSLVSGQSDIRGIALDLLAGTMYWLVPAGVRKADLDGSGVSLMHAFPVGINFSQIAVDPIDQRVYWTEWGAIECVDYDGTNAATVLPLSRPTALVLLDAPEAWSDLGGSLGGAAPAPSLTGTGTLVPCTPIQLSLQGAPSFGQCALIVGVSLLSAPFKGGTLIPNPDLILFQTASFDGKVTIGGPWPLGAPSGLEAWFQYWVTDATGPVGFTASNGVRAVTP